MMERKRKGRRGSTQKKKKKEANNWEEFPDADVGARVQRRA